ncbi:MAG TPA: L,D-transpeptidase [Beijerinckiaceae bacterium]|nr:L,D-transpeptidase [Beijerinckiaceae bacterium]
MPAIGVSFSAEARERVPLPGAYSAGSIIVSTGQRRLYLVLGDGSALRYPVAVGRPGKQWFGQRVVDGKYVRPAWSPPDDVRRDNPHLPNVIPGGVPSNPMGERAITLSPGQYAIHGTNVPGSIGRPASYGCIRMFNHDIVELFERVSLGTTVTVVR